MLVANFTERHQFSSGRSKWVDILRMDLKGKECENVEWINLAKGRIQGFPPLRTS
jgi:hypothetical protein